MQNRPLYEIAKEIREDWKNVSPYAEENIRAMEELDSIEENYYADTARSVVVYFLARATTWRGETARRIKQELKDMLK